MRGHHSSQAWGCWLLPHHVGMHALLIHHSIGWHPHPHAIHLQARLKEACMLWLISWAQQVYADSVSNTGQLCGLSAHCHNKVMLHAANFATAVESKAAELPG